MTKNCIFLPAIALGAALLSQAQTVAQPQTSAAPATLQTKVGIIAFQNAIISTKDGQKAAADLTARFAPKKSARRPR